MKAIVYLSGTVPGETRRHEMEARMLRKYGSAQVSIYANDSHASQEGVQRQRALADTRPDHGADPAAVGFWSQLWNVATGYDEMAHLADAEIIHKALESNPDHLILEASSRGVTGGVSGYVNALYAQALRTSNQGRPTEGQIRRLSLILNDPVSMFHLDHMSTNACEQIPIASKLRTIQENLGIAIDVSLTIPHSVESDTFLVSDNQWTALAEDFPNTRVVYAGFSHNIERSTLENPFDLYLSGHYRRREHPNNYRKSLGETEVVKINRLLHHLQEGIMSFQFPSFPLTQLQNPKYPNAVFDRIFTPKHLSALLMYERLGYVSKDLVDDFQEVLENHEQAVIRRFGEKAHREDLVPTDSMDTSMVMSDLKAFMTAKVKANIVSAIEASKTDANALSKTKTTNGRNPFRTSRGYGVRRTRRVGTE